MKTDLFGKDLKINDYVVTSIYGQTMAGKIYKFTEKTIGLVLIPNTKQKWTPFTTKTLNEVVKLDGPTSLALEEMHGAFIEDLLSKSFS